ncbi:MAG: EF-hand domain-containing protein [Verrucomicrobiota bacterium]
MTTGISSAGFASPNLEAMRQNRFKKADADSDGKITKDELSKVIPQNGKGPSVDEVFTQVDTNQDGAIDVTEDAAALQQMEKSHGASGPHGPGGRPPGPPPDAGKLTEDLFKSVDSDEDGSISEAELTTALSANEQTSSLDAKELFKLLDSDEDGSVTEAELKSALETMFDLQHAGDSGTSSGYDSFGNGTEDATATTFTAVA